MPSQLARLVPVLVASVPTAGCELAGDIFEAGVWVGALVVVLLAVGVVWLMSRLTG